MKTTEERVPSIPAKLGMMLVKIYYKVAKVSPIVATKYSLGTGKLMHTMRFSRTEMHDTDQELARFMFEPSKKHYKITDETIT